MPDKVVSIAQTRGNVLVSFETAEPLRLSPADFAALPLADGQPVDVAAYRAQLIRRQSTEALQRAVTLLAARARSRRELERRLLERGLLPQAVTAALTRLEAEGLVDDEAFARAWAQARAARSMGRARILQELRLKGVADAAAQAAVTALDADGQQEQATQIARKLLARQDDPTSPAARRRMLAAMQRRGYGYAEATRALQAAQSEAEYPEEP